MGFDPVTYAVAKGAANAYTESLIGSVAQGFNYQGSVTTFDDLPTPSASIKGHEYTVSTADASHPTGSYVCDGTAWVPLAVRGPQGIQGIQGVQGIPGPQGTPGINGTNGRDGVDGQDGADGRDGRDGYVQYTAGEGIEISDNTISLSTTVTSQTTAPTAAATDGGIHLVYLDSEPTTKYDGYLYFIKEA